jgi:hypothetical protein
MGIIENHPIMLKVRPRQPFRRSSSHRQTAIARRDECCYQRKAPPPAACHRWGTESRASRLTHEVFPAAFGEPHAAAVFRSLVRLLAVHENHRGPCVLDLVAETATVPPGIDAYRRRHAPGADWVRMVPVHGRRLIELFQCGH